MLVRGNMKTYCPLIETRNFVGHTNNKPNEEATQFTTTPRINSFFETYLINLTTYCENTERRNDMKPLTKYENPLEARLQVFNISSLDYCGDVPTMGQILPNPSPHTSVHLVSCHGDALLQPTLSYQASNEQTSQRHESTGVRFEEWGPWNRSCTPNPFTTNTVWNSMDICVENSHCATLL